MENLEKECTQEQLVKALMEEYDVEEKQAKKDTAAVVGKFREAGILDE
ncbi:MAG: PqqD family protein [Coprococcus sp.]